MLVKKGDRVVEATLELFGSVFKLADSITIKDRLSDGSALMPMDLQ
jgi:hypothetical protein